MVLVIHTHGLASRRVEPKLNQVEPWATYTREHLNGYKWDLNILVEQFNIWWRGWKNSTFRRFCGAVDGMWSLGPRSDLCGQRQTKLDSYIDSRVDATLSDRFEYPARTWWDSYEFVVETGSIPDWCMYFLSLFILF
jgi:hypothetical protein